jgi:hypothetical protein
MVDPTTVNTSLAIPIRGSDVGTWDLPVNGNFNLIDSMFGGVTTIALSSNSVTLLSSQGQQSVVRFTGTINNNVQVILSGIIKGWSIDNQILNSPSSFGVQILTPGSSFGIGAPPGVNDILYDGTSILYRNLERVGTYVDYAGSTLPTWVSLCTKPPFLLCNGTTFSSATYPQLSSLLGSTTLPDARGRVRMMSNLGTSRVTVFNGDTLYLGGGDQQVQAHTHTGSGTTSGISANHTHTYSGTTGFVSADHTHTYSGTTSVEQQGFNFNYSGTTSGQSADHSHALGFSNTGVIANAGFAFAAFGYGNTTNTAGTSNDHSHTYSGTTGTQNQNHTHTYSGTTSGISANHTHTYSGTTSINSVDHTHTFSFTSSSFGAGASLNMQPTYVGGITMIRAA